MCKTLSSISLRCSGTLVDPWKHREIELYKVPVCLQGTDVQLIHPRGLRHEHTFGRLSLVSKDQNDTASLHARLCGMGVKVLNYSGALG